MMRIMWRLFFYGLLVLSGGLRGQNAYREFGSTVEAYQSIRDYSFDVIITVYETKTSKPTLLGKGCAKKRGLLFFSKFEQEEMLQNETNTLFIDIHEKKIDVYDAGSGANKKRLLPVDLKAMIDTLARLNDSSFVYLGIKNGQRCYSKTSPEEVITRSDFFVDVKTRLFSRIVYYYGDNSENYEVGVASVVIDFKNFRFDAPGKDFFSLDNFITKKGKDYFGAKEYGGFKVIHHSVRAKQGS